MAIVCLYLITVVKREEIVGSLLKFQGKGSSEKEEYYNRFTVA